tara:strand:+ start:196 stop:324 length:129 start_codon:yes stop_codon:yes gene_type:complete
MKNLTIMATLGSIGGVVPDGLDYMLLIIFLLILYLLTPKIKI